jgi:aerobic carbon-monoxide dehydrogenase medium subunit
VKPAPFEYVDPRTLDEAVAKLAEYPDDAKVLAGGQSLVPMLNFRLARPRILVDINRLPNLDRLEERDGVLLVGALVRQRALERWALARAPLLAAGLRLVGHVAIRTRGTVAGSIAHADPAAELPALLLCCDGTVAAVSQRGPRSIAAGELFTGPLLTTLAPDELVIETRWVLPVAAAGWGVHEVARRHGDFALAGAAAVLEVRNGRVARARLAVFGCGPTPLRATTAETALEGQAPTPARLEEAARAAALTLPTHDDLHASAEYRRQVAGILMTRALTDAARRAKAVA